MGRNSIVVSTLGAVFVGLVTGPAHATLSANQLGLRLRWAMGFDAQTLSALGVNAENYGTIAEAASSYCDANRGTIESLLAAVSTAKQEALLAYENNGDIETKDQAVQTAIDALAAGCGAAVTTMDSLLTQEQRALRARVAANRLLDVSIAVLTLTPEQKSALQSAQRTRDQLLRNSAQRQDAASVANAVSAFESAVTASLTSEQETDRAGHIATLWEHWKDAQAADEAQLSQ